MRPLALAAALTAAASLLADPGPEQQLLERVYTKLAASYSAEAALGSQGEFLLMAHPGISITPDFLEDAYGISILADQVPLAARTYQPGSATFSATYSTIINQAEVTNFRDMAERDRALEAKRILTDRRRPGHPTPAFAAYLKCRAAYQAAVDALSLARVEQEISGQAVPADLERAVAAAQRDWESKGSRSVIEKAQATLDTYYNSNLKALFGNLMVELQGAATQGGHPVKWYPVEATPPVGEWLSPAGWKPFRLVRNEKPLARRQASLRLQAKPGGATGPALPAAFLTSLTFTLEAKRVNLDRPWLDEGIFKSHGWRMQKTSGFSVVSTGNPADPDPGLMPMLVTGVLLSRNLVLKGAWSGGPAATVQSVGPFSLKGGKAATADGQLTLSVAGVQILGFFCKPIPRSPTPDASAFRVQ